MTRLPTFIRLFALSVLAVAAFCSIPAPAGKPLISGPERQILVMVRQPPEHFRPNGAYGGGYGDVLARSSRERLARRIARAHGLALIDTWPMPMIGMDCFVMAVPDGTSPASAAEQVSHDAEVAWSQPVTLYEAQERAPYYNDPLFAAEPAAREWRLDELHQLSTGRGIKIAIVDSGVETTHPDLSGQIAIDRNFVAGQRLSVERHGTGVAGIIAAKADNGVGIAGIAPGARLLALRACWQRQSNSSTVCDSFSLAKALYFAIGQNADVINLSLSGPDDRLLRQLLKVAVARGSVVVAAFDRNRTGGGFPASAPGVIAVSDQPLARPRAQVYTAPGRNVPTTQPGGKWFLVSGSSYAAAHVSGLVALVRQHRRSAALTLVSERTGGGAINACATLVRVASGCDCSCGPFRTASARPER